MQSTTNSSRSLAVSVLAAHDLLMMAVNCTIDYGSPKQTKTGGQWLTAGRGVGVGGAGLTALQPG